MKIAACSFILSLSVIACISICYSFKKPIDTPNSSSENAPNVGNGVAVLELYTSEGCSSCPPADDILRGVANQENVFALGFHVTYWNRLGWKDSFSQKIFDDRQYKYGTQFQKDGVYTPQLVVNGAEEFVASRKGQVESAIKKALATPAHAQISLTKTEKDGDFDIKYTLSGDLKDAALNFALVESNFATKVKRGENEGRTLKHDNVVRDFETVEIKKAANNTPITEGSHGVFPMKGWQVSNCSLIAFLQDKKTGQVLGAAKMGLK